MNHDPHRSTAQIKLGNRLLPELRSDLSAFHGPAVVRACYSLVNGAAQAMSKRFATTTGAAPKPGATVVEFEGSAAAYPADLFVEATPDGRYPIEAQNLRERISMTNGAGLNTSVLRYIISHDWLGTIDSEQCFSLCDVALIIAQRAVKNIDQELAKTEPEKTSAVISACAKASAWTGVIQELLTTLRLSLPKHLGPTDSAFEQQRIVNEAIVLRTSLSDFDASLKEKFGLCETAREKVSSAEEIKACYLCSQCLKHVCQEISLASSAAADLVKACEQLQPQSAF